MSARSDLIDTTIKRFISDNANDVTGAAVISIDGTLLGSSMAPDVNPERVGAIAATMMGVTFRVVNDLKIGKAEEAIIRADNGYLLVVPISPQIILSITLRLNANLGLARMEARDVVKALASIG